MSIPLIDLHVASAGQLARSIDDALCGAGFFAITGHGVPAAVTAGAFDAGHRFFALEESAKRRWHVEQSRHKRGFDPIGWQSLDPAQPPDVKESFYLGVEAIAPNQWPDEKLVPGFRAACKAYSAQMETLARRLMALFERALGLPSAATRPISKASPSCCATTSTPSPRATGSSSWLTRLASSSATTRS